MTFWSSQKLAANRSVLFPNITSPPAIDCNAITLTVGSEYYVSPSWSDKDKRTITQLDTGESFAIPPGQFAFLQTAQSIRIPRNAMGFISLKATYKLRGLINVSGFHIDPGFDDTLIFTVFNAGPSDVHLREGMDLFLVWIASLDDDSEKYRAKAPEVDRFLQTVNKASGEIKSGYDMAKRIDQLESKVQNFVMLASVLITIATGLSLFLLRYALDVPNGDAPLPPSVILERAEEAKAPSPPLATHPVQSPMTPAAQQPQLGTKPPEEE